MGKYFNFFRDKKTLTSDIEIDKNNIPEHIAIIMDGNGRWAQKRKLPRKIGHKAGVETIRNIVKECSNLGVKYLTLYAFSTENWKRPEDEVSALMNLLVTYLRNELEELHNNDVIINYIGDIEELPAKCINELVKSKEKTKNNKGLTLNLALNYGSRDEIIKAMKNLYSDIECKKMTINDVNEKIFSNYLYTTDMPDPDLLIRTSGEKRLSNFLLWQLSYTEFWFTDVLWPDFTGNHLREAIKEVQNRERRFGGIK